MGKSIFCGIKDLKKDPIIISLELHYYMYNTKLIKLHKPYIHQMRNTAWILN